MITSFRIKCRIDIEATIELPPSGFFVKNETSLRLCYRLGLQMKYINLATRHEVAEFLQKMGIIHFYSCLKGQVTMYELILIQIDGVQHERLVHYRWSDIELTPGQVITAAAEWELKHNKTVQSFINQVFKAEPRKPKVNKALVRSLYNQGSKVSAA
jgi:hypothetical protein